MEQITLVRMIDDDEWHDLTNSTFVDAYNVQQIVILNEAGAGRALLIHLRDARSETVYEFCLSKEMSNQFGWELLGHANDLIAECFPELFDEVADDEE